jgi:hypothetical protein
MKIKYLHQLVETYSKSVSIIAIVTFVTYCTANGQETKSLPVGKNLAVVAIPSGSARGGAVMVLHPPIPVAFRHVPATDLRSVPAFNGFSMNGHNPSVQKK